MNISFYKNRQTSSRKLLVPLFSLLIHLTLFFIVGIQTMQQPIEVKDEEIIAMIDLSELPPELKPPPPPRPPIEKKAALPETNPAPIGEEAPEPEQTAPEAILDPRLDEVLDDEPETDSAPLIETAQNIVIPLPPPEPAAPETPIPDEMTEAETPEPEPEPESESALEPEAPEPVAASLPEESPETPLEPEPLSETPLVPVAPEVTPPAPPPPPVEVPASAQEVAKASEVQDPPQPEKKVVVAIKKPVPPPPPKPKPSKEKVKKSGLLALLGKKKRKAFSKNPLFAKALKRPRKNRLQVSPSKTKRLTTESLQKMAGLKNKLLKSEQKRLMTKRSVRRKKKSHLKIVQGSGRNFGVISSAIAQEEWRLTNVYNRLLQKNPGLQGNLIIEFTISPEGRVIKGHVLTSSFANVHFEKALIQAIRLWKFPVAKEGATTILYPLAFSPAG